MMKSPLILEEAQRSMACLVAKTLAIAAGSLLIVLLIRLFLAYSLVTLVTSALIVLVLIGSCSSIYLLKHHSLRKALAPLLITIFLVVVLMSLLIPELQTVALPFLLLIIVLTSLVDRRDLMLWSLFICSITGFVLTWFTPPPLFSDSLGTLLPVVRAFGRITLLITVWQMLARFTFTLEDALSLIEQRAHEAERARNEAEQSRSEAEQRKTELEYTLELVQELELPIVKIGSNVLLVPLIGHLDKRRVEAIQATLLTAISQSRATTVVFDLTGLKELDSTIAQHLILVGKAARLLGTHTFISGVRANVAQSLANLQLSLDELQPIASLREVVIASE